MLVRYQTLLKVGGFSLIELMVALAIGVFLIAGVFTAYSNGRRGQTTVDDQVAMVDNARFVLETLTADLRQAGAFGRVLAKTDSTGVYNISAANAPAVTAECSAGWTFNVATALQAFDSSNPYGANCNTSYVANTDVLEMRGSLRDAETPLASGKVYLNSDASNASFFAGPTVTAAVSATAKNYPYYAVAYYVSSFSNNAADGIPSLRRVALQPDGTVTDQVLIPGIENLQVQLGLDTDGDGAVDQYVNPVAGTDWGQVKSVQLWLVIRSQEVDTGVVSAAQTATMAGQVVTFANDGRRRVVVGTSIKLRNFNLDT